MKTYNCAMRDTSYGETSELTLLDKLGRYLNQRKLREAIRLVRESNKLADVGCGFDSTLTRPIWNKFQEVHLFDFSINPRISLLSHVRIELHIGDIMETTKLANAKYDLIVCNNVLEHLDDPITLLKQIHNIMDVGSVLCVTVPSWQGKFFLELAAFRFNLAPKLEMEDHRRYYGKWDLWKEIRAAGFLPSKFKVRRIKFGLSTSAVIKK